MTITLTGPNHYALQAELHKLVDEFVGQNGDLALERLDGQETRYERILEAIQSLPFLATKKMVVLRSPSAQKQFTEQFDDILTGVPETTELIIVEPKLDKRLSYFKTLKSKTDFKEFGELDNRGLATWLTEQARAENGTLSNADALFLVERVGVNQELLGHELDKLLSYAANITRKHIELLTEPTPQSSIFELIDAAFAGNAKKTLQLYKEQRALKVEPQQIIAMLAWQLHILAVVKTAGNKSSGEIAKEAKVSPYVVQKTQNIARKRTLTEVKKLVREALALDIRLKSQSIDADEAVQYYLLSTSIDN